VRDIAEAGGGAAGIDRGKTAENGRPAESIRVFLTGYTS